MNPVLQVKNLGLKIKKDEREIRILRNVNFNLYPSRTLAIVGESGCGKTLSALSINRLLPKNAVADGEILYKGKNLLGLPENEMRKIRGGKISMVFQEPMTSLNPVLTVGRQVSETIAAHEKLSAEKIRERAVDLLKKVEIPRAEKRFGDYPHNFSGGMRQRVMIAISMACSPEVIIADEPTTALDVTVQAQILRLFAKLIKENETSLILITHNMALVSQYADFVIVFYGGTVMEKAPANLLFKKPLHPYTKALLESLPKISREKKNLKTIEGAPPNFEEETKGCPFHPRCPAAWTKCGQSLPPEFETGAGRETRCWLYEHS